MIDDAELRDLFANESADILERMERGLLALERTPSERTLIESMFRQAHSLKGSAASLGLSAVEAVAHHFEDALDAARHGRQAMTPERADLLYRTLDVLAKLVDEEVTGRPSGVDLREVLDTLSSSVAGVAPSPSPGTAISPLEPLARVLEPVGLTQAPPEATVSPDPAAQSFMLAASRTAPPAELAPPAQLTSPAQPTAPAQSSASSDPAVSAEPVGEATPNSVRVETLRLDRALAEMGDLVVTAARLGLRRAEAEQLRELHDSSMRDWRLRGGTSTDAQAMQSFGSSLELFIRALSDDQTRLEQITDHLREEIQEMRLLPLAGLLNRFPRVVRDLARQQQKEIRLLLEGGETTADRRLIEKLSAPLTHLIRNAVDHGVEAPAQRRQAGKPPEATLRLAALRHGPLLEVTLQDDGAGLDLAAIRQRALDLGLRTAEQLSLASDQDVSALIFASGFSTRSVVTDLSGRGTGLDAVRSEVEAMNGIVSVHSRRGEGTTFSLRLPLTLATSQVMVCSCGHRLFAIPLAYVERSLIFDSQQTFPMEGRPCLEVEGDLVPVSRLERLLGQAETLAGGTICLILRDQAERHGFVTQGLLGVMEIVVKPFYESRLVGGASILPDGRVCLVLQSTELLRLARSPLTSDPAEAPPAAASVLLAEDSATARAQARQALEQAGYRVVVAENGAEAWRLAREERFDAVVSDIEMPLLDGLQLTRQLRSLPLYRDVPILLVTSLEAEASRLAGLEAGASAYLKKSTFSEGTFLRVLERLL